MPSRPPSHRPARLPVRDGRPSASARGYDAAWRKLRLLVLREVPVCETPLCNAPATQVDHVIALARGGTDERTNLRSYCASCHARKTAIEDGGFGRRATR
jgi:5-methylcytosine-specific restriction protein A